MPATLAASVRKRSSENRRGSARAAIVSQIVTGLRHDARLEPVGRADERDSGLALAQCVGDRDGRVEMSAGAPAGEDDGHVRPPTRRWRPTLAIMATASRLTTSELPPNEMKGRGTPVTGHDDDTTPILTNA